MTPGSTPICPIWRATQSPVSAGSYRRIRASVGIARPRPTPCRRPDLAPKATVSGRFALICCAISQREVYCFRYNFLMSDNVLKDIYWHGDALEVVCKFAKSIRMTIGAELYLLQIGEQPLHCRPMPSVGRGVWEIRVRDGKGAFRVFYVVRRRDGIHVLHAFQKKTKKTAKSDIDIGKSRFRAIHRKK